MNPIKEYITKREKEFGNKVWKKWLDDGFNFNGTFKLRKKEQVKSFNSETIQTVVNMMREVVGEVEPHLAHLATYKERQRILSSLPTYN